MNKHIKQDQTRRIIEKHAGEVKESRLYTGHAKCCECTPCLKMKVARYEEKISRIDGAPPTLHHTVPVKGYWRRGGGGKKKSALRAAIEELAQLLRRNDKGPRRSRSPQKKY